MSTNMSTNMSINTKSLVERDLMLIENWYIACLSSELKNQPITRTLYDVHLVLFRGNNGTPVALIDRCLHRASLLSAGTVENGTLICPYHGWSYNQNGEVVHVPSEGDHQLKGNRCQKTYLTCEQEGVVWIYMGKNLQNAEQQRPSIWKFPNYGQPGWIHYVMVTDFENEATNLVENFMDVPHTVFVHKGWFRNKSLKKVPMTVETKNAGVLVTYHQDQDEIGVLIKKLLNPQNAPMKHTDHFIFPNITNVEYSFGNRYQYVINSQITPITTMKSRVYTYIAYKLPYLGFFLKPFIQFYTRRVIEQDVTIMAIQSKNLNLGQMPTFHSTPADEPHLQIEKLRRLGTLGEDVSQVSKITKTDIWI